MDRSTSSTGYDFIIVGAGSAGRVLGGSSAINGLIYSGVGPYQLTVKG